MLRALEVDRLPPNAAIAILDAASPAHDELDARARFSSVSSARSAKSERSASSLRGAERRGRA